MKKLLTALIAMVLLMPFVFSSCNSSEGFAIYLTRDDVPVSKISLDIAIADEPFISTNDIIAYYKDTHEIELTADAYQRVMELEVPMSGLSFVVCVDKGPIYWGAFWAPVSSQSFDGITIRVPSLSPKDNIIQIELGYPAPSFYQGEDPRSNPAILESLEKAGKLK